MDSVYSKFFTGNSRYNNLSRSSSVPLFNTGNHGGRLPSCLTYNSNNLDKPLVSPELLKMQMMEERLKELEKQKFQQNEQINTLMSYQMNQNRLNKSSSAILLPVNTQPTPLLLTANNVLQPLNYANNLNRYYDMQRYQNNNNPFNRTSNGQYDYNNNNNQRYYNIKTDKDFYRKQKKLQKSYQKSIEAIKDYMNSDIIDEKINKNLMKNIYLPIKKDLNNFMEEINYNLQRKMENDNNVINNNINAVQNNYDEIRYLLQDKIDKMELKQKMDMENLKNQIQNNINNRQKEEKLLNNSIYEMKIMELENKKKSKEKELLFQSELNEHISEEIRKQRELDEIKHQKELDQLRRMHELEDLENKKIVEELRFKKMKEDIMRKRKPPVVQPMIQQMPFPFIYPIPNNNGNNSNKGDDLFKLFMMKSIFGKDLFGSGGNKKKKIKI